MPNLSERDELNLRAILESIQKIQTFTNSVRNTKDFYEDERTFDAVLMNFVIIGECVSRLSAELREKESSIPWQQIKSFRNFVTHNYFGIDSEEVWQVIHSHLPQLKDRVTELLKIR